MANLNPFLGCVCMSVYVVVGVCMTAHLCVHVCMENSDKP